MNGSIPVTFINHVECRCDDHILTSFAGLEMAEISIDEAIIRQVLNS